MPASTIRSERVRLARGGADGGDDLGAAHAWTVSSSAARATRAASIESCSDPSRPMPRVGLAGPHRPLRRRLRARHRARGARGRPAAEVRGESGELLEFVLNPATARFVPRGERAAAPRLELLARRPALSGSGHVHVREVLRAVLAQRLADPRALRRAWPCAAAPSSSRWPLDRHARDHPAHGEALEQQLDRALPGVLARDAARRRRRAPRRTRAASRRSASRAACSTLPSRVGVVAARAPSRRRCAAARRLPTLRQPASAARSRAAAHVAGDRLGVARPGGRGLQRGELAHARARLLGVVVVDRDRHVRRGSRGPTCRACRSSRCSARGGRTRATGRSARARGPAARSP